MRMRCREAMCCTSRVTRTRCGTSTCKLMYGVVVAAAAAVVCMCASCASCCCCWCACVVDAPGAPSGLVGSPGSPRRSTITKSTGASRYLRRDASDALPQMANLGAGIVDDLGNLGDVDNVGDVALEVERAAVVSNQTARPVSVHCFHVSPGQLSADAGCDSTTTDSIEQCNDSWLPDPAGAKGT